MRTLLCDASPLIFLAKLDALGLIAEVLDGELVVLECVAHEVCAGSAGEVERIRLLKFLKKARVVAFSEAIYPSRSLSETDRCLLNWAIQHRPCRLIADERLLRRIAKEEGIAVIGTFGILVAAARDGVRAPGEIRAMVKELVGVHGCRISVELYQRVMDVLIE